MKRPADHSSEVPSRHPAKRPKTKDTTMDEEIDGPYVPQFKVYQQQLDSRNDRRERLIRLSRDITAGSKKAIFALHRVAGQGSSKVASCLAEATGKLNEMREHIKGVAAEVAENDTYYLHHRSFSPGVQEYIEAESFYIYLKEQRLVTLADIEHKLCFSAPAVDHAEEGEEKKEAPPLQMMVTTGDYLLGLADLTGELMRYSINSLGKGGDLDCPGRVLAFVRGMFLAMSRLTSNNLRELPKKMKVMEQSLKKIEKTCYNITVRGAEIPKERMLEMVAKAEATGREDDGE